jgi:predicted component of type VI protein secretion system
VGSTTEELIRHAGFDIMLAPSATLPNHYRITHANGLAGFSDQNLAQLAAMFTETTGH